MTESSLSVPMPLDTTHDLDRFDCGVGPLTDWLKRRAVGNEISGASRTYVICVENAVVAYYCLSSGGVLRVEAPKAIQRNMPDPIPVIVLGRLAVDLRYQRRGLGHALLRDAVLRTLQVADVVGIAALLVHAISDDAKAFYLSNGFLESPIAPLTLCLPLATARSVLST